MGVQNICSSLAIKLIDVSNLGSYTCIFIVISKIVDFHDKFIDLAKPVIKFIKSCTKKEAPGWGPRRWQLFGLGVGCLES